MLAFPAAAGRVLAVATIALVLAPAADGQQTPSDARQPEQWAVASGSLVDLPGAWEISEGAGVVVAVIDTGTRLEHPDLAPNAWVNFDEIPGNGIDDDHNGYVDDVNGVDLTKTAPSQDLSDGNGHGTHVAGIIAAAANGRGVVGVAPKAKIMTVKALDASGSGTTAAVAEGIRYAAANGARIINMSLGGDEPDPRLQEAIAAAAAANVLVVCSAGNSGRNIDQQPSFPVSVPAPNLIGVAATSPNEGRALSGFSNYGQLTVALAAPGERVLSTSNDGTYATMSGTSMAAPHVTGVAALMAAVRPDLPAVDLRAALLQNALPAALPVGSGYLYARGAVMAVSGAVDLGRGQRPEVRILKAERSGSGAAAVTRAQVTVEGATQAVVDFRVRIDGRQAAILRKRAIPFTVRVRGRSGGRLQVEARNAEGKVLGASTHRIRVVRRGKRDIHKGRRVRGGTATASPPGRARPIGAAAQRGTISMSGSSTVLPLVADLAYFYRRAHRQTPRFSLVGGDTPVGISDAARGVTSAGMAARGRLTSDPPGLVFTSIALSGVCLVTNQSNPLPGVSRATIQDLVSGRVVRWTQVPGSARTDAIASSGLLPGLAGRIVFAASFVDATTTIGYQPRSFDTMAQVRDYVLTTPNAWGYVDLSLTTGLHVLRYEGVTCDRETVGSRAYPATRPLTIVTRGAPKGAVAGFLRWIRTSDTARRVIATRYVPTL